MSTDIPAAFRDSGWFEEYDCVPLRLRLKMLRARVHMRDNTDESSAVQDEERKQTSHSIFFGQKEDVNLDPEDNKVLQCEDCPSVDILMKTSELPNDGVSDSGLNFVSMVDNASGHSVGSPGDFDQNRGSKSHICSREMPTSEARAEVVGKQPLKIEVDTVSYLTSVDVPGYVKTPLHDSVAGSNGGHALGGEVEHGILYKFDDHLDNVVLGERRRMLVSRKLLQSSGLYVGGNYGRLSSLSEVVLQGHVQIEMQKSDSIEDMLIDKNINPEVKVDHEASRSGIDRTSHTVKKSSPPISDNLRDVLPIESKASPISAKSKSFGRLQMTMTIADAMAGPVSSFLARVKNEPVGVSELCSEGKNGMQHFFTSEILPVKSEPGFSDFLGDELDHLPLVDRVKLLSSGTSSLNKSQSVEFLNENVASSLDVGTDLLESVKPMSISRPWKRRKTATNSIETALEEDAPELLKVLIERGVSLEEIKLYGEGESEDAIDESLSEDSFAELEAVISQMFSQRQSFLKFPLLRFTKKASYCLSCLLSLVEQTRYLQHRKWPVEWGWCRDLQSFIFVFQRHNRIVLERPEYGFATYFFELLNSLPVHWQIKRLVTAMKLTSCGRIALIENKPLVVGEDLSEGEARVLAEYGWTPNTGLGTMLNYCDRVVHDRKQDIDSLEWRSKIARQLMNGYNGGNIISKDLPKKFVEFQSSEGAQVKVEKLVDYQSHQSVQVKLEQ